MTGLVVLYRGKWAVRYDRTPRVSHFLGLRQERVWYAVIGTALHREYAPEESIRPGAPVEYLGDVDRPGYWRGRAGWYVVTGARINQKFLTVNPT